MFATDPFLNITEIYSLQTRGGPYMRCGVFLSFLGHHLNIYHPISDVIPLSGKWSCRYLPESQPRNLNQGKNK